MRFIRRYIGVVLGPLISYLLHGKRDLRLLCGLLLELGDDSFRIGHKIGEKLVFFGFLESCLFRRFGNRRRRGLLHFFLEFGFFLALPRNQLLCFLITFFKILDGLELPRIGFFFGGGQYFRRLRGSFGGFLGGGCRGWLRRFCGFILEVAKAQIAARLRDRFHRSVAHL